MTYIDARDRAQVLLVYLPVNQSWWSFFGIPSHNPGTWNDCAIVADDGSQRLMWPTLEAFRQWNTANRRNPMCIVERFGPNLYGIA